MIEKEGGKEAAESSAGGSLRAADTKEMRAVVLSAFGGLNKLRVSKKAMPEPQEGELKIRVKAWSSIASLPGRGCAGLSAGWGRGRRVPGGGTSPLVASRRPPPVPGIQRGAELRAGRAPSGGAGARCQERRRDKNHRFSWCRQRDTGKKPCPAAFRVWFRCELSVRPYRAAPSGPCGARSVGPAADCRHGAVPARLAV